MQATVELTTAMIRKTAHQAADDFFKVHMSSRDGGACGFAWVTIYPEHRGNTRLGKAERLVLESLGFGKDWTGKAYEMWNPSGYPVQNIDTLEAGARAAAALLKTHGFTAYAGSRLD